MRSLKPVLSVLSVAVLVAGTLVVAGPDRSLEALAQAAGGDGSADNLLDPDVRTFAVIDGWTPSDGVSVHHSTVTGHSDDTSLQVTVLDQDLSTAAVVGPSVEVQGGHTYRASWHIRPATSTTGVHCVLTFFDDAGQRLAATDGEPVDQSADEWTEAACEATAPADAATAAVGIVVMDVTAGDVHHVDDAGIFEVEGSQPPDDQDAPDEPPAAGGTNLLSDNQHSFETSTAGWAEQGNTVLARKVGTAAVGESSLMIIVDDSGAWPDSTRTARAGTHYLRDHGVAVDAGTRYQASWRIKGHTTDAPARCELRWYDAQDREIDTVAGETVTVTGDDWTTARCGGQAPEGSSHVSLRVFLAEVDYGSVFYVDDAWLTAADGAPSPAPSPTPDPRPTPTTAPDPDPAPPEDPEPTAAPDPTEDPEPEPTEELDPEPTAAPDPTEDPDPEPTGDPDPAPPPPGGAPSHGQHVNASNTGPSANGLSYAQLRPSGSITTSRHGQVIEGLDVTGSIIVNHDNVVIRNSRVRQSSHYAIHGSGRNALIEYVEVDGRNNPDRLGILMTSGWKVRYTEVRGHSSGVRLSSGTTLEYSYVHSQALKPGSHNTAAAFHGGSGVKVLNNHLVGSTSSSLSLYPDVPVVDVLVQGNLFNGGSYCLYAGYGPKPGASQSRDLRYVDNLFAQSPFPLCGHFGPYTNWDASKPGNVWTGNTYQDGSPLN